MRTVYLAGPMGIDGVDDIGWRPTAKATLEAHGLKVIVPHLLGEYLDRFDLTLEQAGEVLTARDRRSATESDYMLVNFDGVDVRSIGTCIELGWADLGRPITVSVLPEGCAHDHAMVRNLSDHIVGSLVEGLLLVLALDEEDMEGAEPIKDFDWQATERNQ